MEIPSVADLREELERVRYAERFRQFADLCRTWYDKGPGDWAPLSVEALTNRVCLLFNFGADKAFTDRTPLVELNSRYHMTPDAITDAIRALLR